MTFDRFRSSVIRHTTATPTKSLAIVDKRNKTPSLLRQEHIPLLWVCELLSPKSCVVVARVLLAPQLTPYLDFQRTKTMIEIPAPIAQVIDQAIEHVYSFEPLVAKTVILGECNNVVME